jgi:hypothetical protein
MKARSLRCHRSDFAATSSASSAWAAKFWQAIAPPDLITGRNCYDYNFYAL